MPRIHSPLDIYLGNQTERPDVFTLVFIFSVEEEEPLNSLLLSRGPDDPPGAVWIQPDDETHGFHARDVGWVVDGPYLTITLSGTDRFYWDGSQSLTIELFERRAAGVRSCLRSIFAPPVLGPPE